MLIDCDGLVVSAVAVVVYIRNVAGWAGLDALIVVYDEGVIKAGGALDVRDSFVMGGEVAAAGRVIGKTD